MARIEINLTGPKGEGLTLKNSYNGIYNVIKTGIKDEKPYFAITPGSLGIYFIFEAIVDFKNFINNLKADFLQIGDSNANPENFKVEVYRDGEGLVEGEYSYLEFINHGDKPAFFISVNTKPHGSFEINFYFDIKDELQKLLDNVEQTVRNNIIKTNKDNRE